MSYSRLHSQHTAALKATGVGFKKCQSLMQRQMRGAQLPECKLNSIQFDIGLKIVPNVSKTIKKKSCSDAPHIMQVVFIFGQIASEAVILTVVRVDIILHHVSHSDYLYNNAD